MVSGKAFQHGIIVTNNNYRRDSTSVEVVDSEFLTSYPYTYEFAGWSVDFSNVTSNLIVKANYKEIENKK